jgi:hypothetical protein
MKAFLAAAVRRRPGLARAGPGACPGRLGHDRPLRQPRLRQRQLRRRQPGAIQGRLGYRFNTYLGVEGELSGGVKSDDIDVAGVPVDVKLQHAEAIYGVGFLPSRPTST